MATDAGTATKDAPTTELVAGAVGDRCSNCQAPLATDQRYCVNCGTRRGKARFSAATLAPEATAAAASAPPPAPARMRGGGATTLIAGVATLLIAMGVGFLIGHNSGNSPSRTPAAQVITVNGGSGSAAPTASTPTSRPGRHAKAGKAPKTVVVHITPKVQKAAAQAAAHVFGSNGNLSSNVTQQQGGSCTGGAGCQNGKFTGNFFGQ